MLDYSKFVIEGKGRADLTLLFKDPDAFEAAVKDMAEPFKTSGANAVAALDALGFIFGTAIAGYLNIGLILVRKGGKVSVPVKSIAFSDYSKREKSFEIVLGAIAPQERILVVDEWSETGSQLKAAIALIESMEGEVVGVSCFSIDAPVRNDPSLAAYHLHSLLGS